MLRLVIAHLLVVPYQPMQAPVPVAAPPISNAAAAAAASAAIAAATAAATAAAATAVARQQHVGSSRWDQAPSVSKKQSMEDDELAKRAREKVSAS